PDLAYDEPRRMNLYAFNLNNALTYIDPDGRVPIALAGCAANPAACAAAATAAAAAAAAAAQAMAATAERRGDAISDIEIDIDFTITRVEPKAIPLEPL